MINNVYRNNKYKEDNNNMPEAKFRVKILPSNDGYLTDMIEYAYWEFHYS